MNEEIDIIMDEMFDWVEEATDDEDATRILSVGIEQSRRRLHQAANLSAIKASIPEGVNGAKLAGTARGTAIILRTAARHSTFIDHLKETMRREANRLEDASNEYFDIRGGWVKIK